MLSQELNDVLYLLEKSQKSQNSEKYSKQVKLLIECLKIKYS